MQFKVYSHQFWMQEAIKAAREVKNEIPVCALIVKGNSLLSKAVNKIEALQDATLHAELLAIKEASQVLNSWRLKDCVLYSTLEPCSMCAGAILNSRISTIVFGAYDLNCGACGSVINLFNDLKRQNQVDIIGGILEMETGELLKSFFLAKR